MPALSASRTSSSGSITRVAPASTASTRQRALRSESTVRGPTAGRSKRRSCCGLTAFTTTAPTESSPPRRMQASVPSSASTATPQRSFTTTVWPRSSRPMARANSSP